MLLIKPSGSKIWQFKYDKPITKKRTTISFGKYPIISLADARKLRDSALKLLAKNIDPQLHKQEIEEQEKNKYKNTLRSIAIDWFRLESNKNMTTDTLIRKCRSLENHVFYCLGDLPISSITSIQFIDAITHLSKQGNLDMLSRVTQRINQIMIYDPRQNIRQCSPL